MISIGSLKSEQCAKWGGTFGEVTNSQTLWRPCTRVQGVLILDPLPHPLSLIQDDILIVTCFMLSLKFF